MSLPSGQDKSPALSVPLPSRSRPGEGSRRPSVWTINPPNTEPPPESTQDKCEKDGRDGGVCCKDLEDDDERTLIDPDIVRDM